MECRCCLQCLLRGNPGLGRNFTTTLFRNLPRLRQLYLEEIGLTEIPFTAEFILENLPDLQELYLNNNLITVIRDLSDLQPIKPLQVSFVPFNFGPLTKNLLGHVLAGPTLFV